MFHEQPHPAARKPKTKPARLRRQPQSPTDTIVWAAYRKFSKTRSAREAMEQCLAEDLANAKRRVLP